MMITGPFRSLRGARQSTHGVWLRSGPTTSDLRSRPNIAASIRGCARIAALLPRIVVALSARTLSARCVRARPRSNRGSMRAGRCVRASRSPSRLCRAAHA